MEDFKVGDLVRHGSLMWEDTPEYTVWLTRDGDNIKITTEWKTVQALLDANVAEANDFSNTGKHSDIVKVAGVPIGLYFEWQQEGITDDPEAMRRRLNDGDYSKFRTNGWRL
ncbi:hypothetical protein [Endobacterium cereale]|uniref:hypothetical protein n=1 Tax=Endobacterium cereale TaxID=2663029 RepID=UPI002B486D4D|nr:hypothetical protein [Endobacterium cereale]MEB2843805.1 hypothetical protein [Endobacterium cereale]